MPRGVACISIEVEIVGQHLSYCLSFFGVYNYMLINESQVIHLCPRIALRSCNRTKPKAKEKAAVSASGIIFFLFYIKRNAAHKGSHVIVIEADQC